MLKNILVQKSIWIFFLVYTGTESNGISQEELNFKHFNSCLNLIQ